MRKTIGLLFSILLLITASHEYSFAQIISEKKLTDIPYVSVLQLADDEYIYVGTEVNRDRNEYDVVLTNVDLKGKVKWKKNIVWEFDCTVRDAALLSDKSILVAGSARKSTYQSYPFIMKIDTQGDTLWTRYYDSGHQAEQVIGTSDGGYLFAFYWDGSGLMKLDAAGDTIWSRRIGEGRPFGLTETSEGVYLLVDN